MSSPAQGLPTDGQRLFDIRRRLGFSQTEMASRMGIGMRTVQELEKSPEPLRACYLQAAEFIALEQAVLRKDQSLASRTMVNLARHLADIVDAAIAGMGGAKTGVDV